MNKDRTVNNRLVAICLALYVGLVPLNSQTFSGIGSIYKFVVLGIAAFLLLIMVQYGIWKFESSMVLWGAYTAYLGVSVIWAQNAENSWSYFVGMIQVYAISLLFLQTAYTEKQHNTIKWIAILSGIVFFSLQIMYGSKQIYTDRQIISFGALGGMDPNEFCGYLLLPIAICVQTFFSQAKGRKKVALLVVLAMLAYSIMLAGSRGGLLAAVVTILVAIMKSGQFSVKKLFYIIVITGVGTVLFVYVIIPNLSEILLKRFSITTIRLDAGSGRSDIWLKTLKMLSDDPLRLLFGCGAFGATSVPYCSHNMILQVLLDSGIFGLLIYVAFLINMIKNLKYREPYIVAAFWGIQASMLTLSAYAWFKAVWIIYLLCLIKIKPSVEQNSEGRRTIHEAESITV